MTVTEVFSDQYSSWNFGQFDFIDSIKDLQDGQRVRFPIFYNASLLSFEVDPDNPDSSLIDLDALLLIFVNGVIQEPGSLTHLMVVHHLNSYKHQILMMLLIYSSTKEQLV